MKTKQMIKELTNDGWFELKRKKGSHRQFKHPTKKGRVTVSDHGKNIDLPRGTEKSIRKQAGLD